jgi:hypothetical protein
MAGLSVPEIVYDVVESIQQGIDFTSWAVSFLLAFLIPPFARSLTIYEFTALLIFKGVIRGLHEHGICAVAFDGEGDRVLSVGLDRDHIVAVWDWRTGEKLASACGHPRSIICIARKPSSVGAL